MFGWNKDIYGPQWHGTRRRQLKQDTYVLEIVQTCWLTLTSMTLVIFHKSMRRPMKTLTCTTKLVSLSRMYNSTTSDWNTPKMMERTDKPSRDCRLFQNWISEREESRNQAKEVKPVQSNCVGKKATLIKTKTWKHTILEGEEFKDAVHNGDNNG